MITTVQHVVHAHRRSPKGARQKAIQELMARGLLSEGDAEAVVKLATPAYALQAYNWSRTTFQFVHRHIPKQGGTYDGCVMDVLVYQLIRSLWQEVLDSPQVKHIRSVPSAVDQNWLHFAQAHLGTFGLRLPVPQSAWASIKILRGGLRVLLWNL